METEGFGRLGQGMATVLGLFQGGVYRLMWRAQSQSGRNRRRQQAGGLGTCKPRVAAGETEVVTGTRGTIQRGPRPGPFASLKRDTGRCERTTCWILIEMRSAKLASLQQRGSEQVQAPADPANQRRKQANHELGKQVQCLCKIPGTSPAVPGSLDRGRLASPSRSSLEGGPPQDPATSDAPFSQRVPFWLRSTSTITGQRADLGWGGSIGRRQG